MKPGLVLILFLVSSFPLDAKAIGRPSAPGQIQGQPVARIPFRLNSGLITVPVRVNDSKELTMYLDTGMSAPIVVLFHKELIEETGLKNTQKIQLGGAGGGQQKPGTLAQGARVRLMDLEMAGQTIVVFDDSRAASEWRLDGIIGRSLFDNYLAHIDYEKSVLSLYPPSDARVDSSLIPIPVNLDIGIPIIETAISLFGRSDIPVKLVVDLGHRNALYFNIDETKNIRAPETTIKSMAGRGIQGEVPSKIGRLTELKFGPYSFKNIPTSFLEPGSNMGLSKELMDGNLGQLILNRFDVILDYRNKQILLAPNRYYDRPFEYDMAGLILEQDRDGVYEVRFVIENSPAAVNGILKGDKIVSLNGKDVREYPFREVFDLLRQDGRIVKMTTERKNERFEKTITLKRLI
jgi:hypothetical protein